MSWSASSVRILSLMGPTFVVVIFLMDSACPSAGFPHLFRGFVGFLEVGPAPIRKTILFLSCFFVHFHAFSCFSSKFSKKHSVRLASKMKIPVFCKRYKLKVWPLPAVVSTVVVRHRCPQSSSAAAVHRYSLTSLSSALR